MPAWQWQVHLKDVGSRTQGMPHKVYHGRTGVVWNVTKRAVGVEVNKQVRSLGRLGFAHRMQAATQGQTVAQGSSRSPPTIAAIRAAGTGED